LARRYFGTDGVRGVVGDDLTPELVERLGRAATRWSGRGRVFVGRDTRGSGPELEEAFARGVVAAGGNAVLAGVLPTPAVALLALDLGVVISASHNPPEYNGVKFFDHGGSKLTDEQEEQIEALLDDDAPPAGGGSIDRVGVAPDSYLEHVVERFGSDLTGLRVAVDCANGAY
jgi:phosphoglucosamine mutase